MNNTVATESLGEFFHNEISQAIARQKATLSTEAQYYLVNLLTEFAQIQHSISYDEQGKITEKPLALCLLEAVMADRSSQISLLKKMGDSALYVSGFFVDSLVHKLVGLDYYIQMGHTAYSSVSHLIPSKKQAPLKGLFGELAANFSTLVDVIGEVADSTHLKSDQNLLKLYERWEQTGSERVRQLLTSQGIIPTNHGNG